MIQAFLIRLYRSPVLAWFRPLYRMTRAVCRRLFLFFRDPRDRGVVCSFGGHHLRVPVECANYWHVHYTNYEFPAAKAFGEWFEQHPTGLLLDVGCELGQYSLLALARGEGVEVIAFDADVAGLKATSRMCRLFPQGRLRLVYGLQCADASTSTFANAEHATTRAIEQCPENGMPGSSRFVCLDSSDTENVPRYTLSQLLVEADPKRPTLLKCDVEGGEFEVLKGAARVLSLIRPVLLVSVHPDLLPRLGSTATELAEWLAKQGYTRRLLGVDHEEHWWCEPIQASKTTTTISQ